MLEEPSDNADDMDVLSHSLHSGDKAADPADDHVDMDSRTGCLDQFVDDPLIGQRIQLQADICISAILLILDLLLDHIDNPGLETLRSDKKMF